MSVGPMSLEDAGHRGWEVSFTDSAGTDWQYYINSRRHLVKPRITRRGYQVLESKPPRD